MNKEQAKTLIKHTFEASFDKEKFTKFIKNLLNRIDESKAFHARGDVKEMFRNVIKTYERIGTYNSPEGKKIDVIITYLQKGHSLDHARVTQRNFAGRYLADRGGKDAGLFAFVSPEESDWRFSLVKMDYKFEKTKTGKMKVKEELTLARRWSFLVGANEKSHTAQSQLVDILKDDEHDPILEEIEKAFDIETVTKEFFLKYRELFLRTKEELDKVVKNDPKIKDDFESKGVDTVNFAKKLLGQIIFLYFLQKKGWFGVGRDDDWGTGSKHFLRELFEKNHGDYLPAPQSKAPRQAGKNFFNDILEPLFYEALRRDRSDDDGYYSRFNCKIPFLNGGLFDPIGSDRGYNWVDTDIFLPDKLFSNTNKAKEGDIGTGILDIFDRYNFTVKEDEPLEKEVAIDPELLGKSYEKFNAIRPDNFEEFKKVLKNGRKGEENKFNKKFGVYYTPREIVHYMCQQSLINDLATKMDGKVSKEDIENLIHTGEKVNENEARVLRKGKETETYSHKLPESIRKNAKLIDEKLADITVCDPAVGSGAFPVGMMSEIVRARNVLSVFLKDNGRTTYDFKRQCIEHSIYGVDIDPGAVEIAKLRLWLSLVVDEDDIKNIKPLPNLDYKIVCGNSLFGVEKNLFNLKLFNDLEKSKPLFFNETNPRKKQEYKKQIEELISKITNGHKEFDFEVYFSEVFHEKKGFDVVIANPPYVSFGLRGLKKPKKEWDEVIRKKYPNSAEYKLNTYTIFMDKGIQLLKNNGVITYITPDSFLLGMYFSKIRKFILNTCKIQAFLMFERDFWESGVVGRSVISIFVKTNNPTERKRNKINAILCSDIEALCKNTLKHLSYEQKCFESLNLNKFRLFFDETTKHFVDIMEYESILLGNIAKITTGVRSKIGQKQIVSDKQLGSTWKKGLISGSQVSPFFVKWGGHFINIDKKLLWSGGWDSKIVENPKLMIRQTGDSIIAGIDYNRFYHLNNIHSLSIINPVVSIEYLAALLNSQLMKCYYRIISLEWKRAMAQIDIETLESLPIKIPSNDEIKLVENLVKKITTRGSAEVILEEIDELFRKIYKIPKELKEKVYKETNLIKEALCL